MSAQDGHGQRAGTIRRGVIDVCSAVHQRSSRFEITEPGGECALCDHRFLRLLR